MHHDPRMQVSIYECDGRVDGEETTGDVEVDSTGDYTGLVSMTVNRPMPSFARMAISMGRCQCWRSWEGADVRDGDVWFVSSLRESRSSPSTRG